MVLGAVCPDSSLIWLDANPQASVWFQWLEGTWGDQAYIAREVTVKMLVCLVNWYKENGCMSKTLVSLSVLAFLPQEGKIPLSQVGAFICAGHEMSGTEAFLLHIVQIQDSSALYSGILGLTLGKKGACNLATTCYREQQVEFYGHIITHLSGDVLQPDAGVRQLCVLQSGGWYTVWLPLEQWTSSKKQLVTHFPINVLMAWELDPKPLKVRERHFPSGIGDW